MMFQLSTNLHRHLIVQHDMAGHGMEVEEKTACLH